MLRQAKIMLEATNKILTAENANYLYSAELNREMRVVVTPAAVASLCEAYIEAVEALKAITPWTLTAISRLSPEMVKANAALRRAGEVE